MAVPAETTVRGAVRFQPPHRVCLCVCTRGPLLAASRLFPPPIPPPVFLCPPSLPLFAPWLEAVQLEAAWSVGLGGVLGAVWSHPEIGLRRVRRWGRAEQTQPFGCCIGAGRSGTCCPNQGLAGEVGRSARQCHSELALQMPCAFRAHVFRRCCGVTRRMWRSEQGRQKREGAQDAGHVCGIEACPHRACVWVRRSVRVRLVGTSCGVLWDALRFPPWRVCATAMLARVALCVSRCMEVASPLIHAAGSALPAASTSVGFMH